MTISQHNRSKLTARGALVLGVALVALTLTGCTNREHAAFSHSLANQAREGRGLHGLRWDDTAGAKAQAWADQMAARFSVSHSNLSAGMGGNWRYLAENVGVGTSVQQVHDALMRSSGHRANILGSRYSSVGVGVAERNGYYFVAQVFKG